MLPIVGALLAAGCSRGFVSPPRITANPNQRAPLAAILTFEAHSTGMTLLEIGDGERSFELRYDSSHRPQEGLPVVGLRPGRWHTIRVALLESAAGREVAAECDSSVSALVRTFLERLGGGPDFERRKRLQTEAMDSIEAFRASDRMSRDEAHRRAVR